MFLVLAVGFQVALYLGICRHSQVVFGLVERAVSIWTWTMFPAMPIDVVVNGQPVDDRQVLAELRRPRDEE